MNNVNLPKVDKLAQREKKESSSETASTVTEVPLKKLQTGNGLEATKSKKRKLNGKKGADLPRRTSKRLAGIEVNISLEPIMHTRVRCTAGRQNIKKEVNCADEDKKSSNSDECAKSVRTGNGADKKQERLDVLPPGDATFPEEHVKEGIADCKGDEKPEVPLDLSFTNLWKDPCIEFAVKTLTSAMPIGNENNVAINQDSSSNFPDADSCMDLPSKDIWSDPCFEFAVKILTGEIDTTIDTILQQPLHNPSETTGHNGLTLPTFRWPGYSHTRVSFMHPSVAETAIHKQQL